MPTAAATMTRARRAGRSPRLVPSASTATAATTIGHHTLRPARATAAGARPHVRYHGATAGPNTATIASAAASPAGPSVGVKNRTAAAIARPVDRERVAGHAYRGRLDHEGRAGEAGEEEPDRGGHRQDAESASAHSDAADPTPARSGHEPDYRDGGHSNTDRRDRSEPALHESIGHHESDPRAASRGFPPVQPM